MKGNLNKIFWGLILIILDINIGIDILPDIVGYGLIFYGIEGIVKYSEASEDIKKTFSKGIIPCTIMIVVELVDIIMSTDTVFVGTLYKHIYTAAVSIASFSYLVVVFSICSGMYEIAKVKGEGELGKSILKTWRAYACFFLLSTIMLPLTINIDRIYDSITVEGILRLITIILLIIQVNIIIKLRSLRDSYKLNF